MGFCMGVRRAVQIMEVEAGPGRPVYSVGEIVHNPHVVRSLERSGVIQLPGPDEVDGDIGAATVARMADGGRVAITAHGVGERVVRELEATGLSVIDTTCPIVTRAQRYAQKFVREGYHVIIFGDPGHKEVRGIAGWTRANGGPGATIVERADLDALRALIDGFPGGFPHKVGLMVQTTHKVEDFARFVSNLMLLQRDENFELHVVNTLCHATTGQQEAAALLARQVDLMVVVGGKKSANTRHLREVCEEQGTRAYHIEGPEELDAAWFASAARVGLTAGASTPDSSIDEVEARIHELAG